MRETRLNTWIIARSRWRCIRIMRVSCRRLDPGGIKVGGVGRRNCSDTTFLWVNFSWSLTRLLVPAFQCCFVLQLLLLLSSDQMTALKLEPLSSRSLHLDIEHAPLLSTEAPPTTFRADRIHTLGVMDHARDTADSIALVCPCTHREESLRRRSTRCDPKVDFFFFFSFPSSSVCQTKQPPQPKAPLRSLPPLARLFREEVSCVVWKWRRFRPGFQAFHDFADFGVGVSGGRVWIEIVFCGGIVCGLYVLSVRGCSCSLTSIDRHVLERLLDSESISIHWFDTSLIRIGHLPVTLRRRGLIQEFSSKVEVGIGAIHKSRVRRQ